jgi:hypothetical protein
LTCYHEEFLRMPLGVRDGMQLGIQTSLHALDQAAMMVSDKPGAI